MKRGAILVAGGAGYIGSHVCKALAAEGYLPVTLDDLSSGHAEAVQWGPLDARTSPTPRPLPKLCRRMTSSAHFISRPRA